MAETPTKEMLAVLGRFRDEYVAALKMGEDKSARFFRVIEEFRTLVDVMNDAADAIKTGRFGCKVSSGKQDSRTR